MRFTLLQRGLAGLLFACLLAATGPAAALELIVTPDTGAVELAPGATLTVMGTLTNLSGAALLSSDIFFNFSGYPEGSLEINQLLGLEEFALPERSISAPAALFSLHLLPSAASGSYAFEYFAVDINGVFSNVSTLTVSAVPEPAAAPLLAAGLLLLTCLTGLAPLRRPSPNRAPNGA